MRGSDEQSGLLCRSEGSDPAKHPLRKIRQVVNDALARLIQILCPIRPERQVMEQMQLGLMLRWF